MRFWFPILLSFLLTGLALASSEGPSRLDHGWQVSWDSGTAHDRMVDWKSINLPCVSTFEVKDWKISARLRLPSFSAKDASIFIKLLDQPFTVEIDGVEIYRFGNLSSQKRTFLGLPWHIIPLPNNFQGKFLVFNLRKSDDPKTGLCDEVFIGSNADHLTKMIVDNFDVIVLSTVSVVTFMLNLIIAISMRSSRPYTAFALFALSTGTWVFSNSSNQIKLLLLNDPVMWSWLDLTSLYLIPAFLLLFAYQVFGNRRVRVLLSLSRIHFAYAMIATALSISGVIDPKAALFPYNIIVPISILVLTACTVVLMSKKESDASLIGLGLLCMMGFAVHDLLVGLQVLPWTRHTLQFGLTSMLVPFSIIVVRRLHQLLDTQKKAEFNILKERQRAEIMQNLAHDIKNPLAVFELISASNTWEEFLNWKAEMARSISQVHAIIADFKKDAGDLTLNLKEDTLDIYGLASVANKALASGDVSITSDSECAGVLLKIDRVAIERALMNLITNAVEAGAQSINVRAQINSKDLIVLIIDNGPGVPIQILHSLFQRGQSFGKSGGQGIGLFNVKCIAAGHGGTVNYTRKSSLSVFELYLPNCVIGSLHSPHDIQNEALNSDHELKKSVLVAIKNPLRKTEILQHLAKYPVKIQIEETDIGPPSLVFTDDPSLADVHLDRGVHIVVDNGKDDPEYIARRLVRNIRAISETISTGNNET